MDTLAERLKKRRRDEQEIRGYANSSRWYTGLSNAISFVDRAETGTDPISRFSDAWSVAYNLFMMHGEPGDQEYRRFNSWVSAVKDYARVRHHFVNSSDPVHGAFRQAVERAKKTLLKPDGLQALESWTKNVSPDKACRYFFLIIRDMRNTAYHPEFNPKTAPVKKAIGLAADALIPIVAAAVDATIEHPVPGTTGRATAYRFFLYPFLKNSDGFFSDYYLERLFPDEELAAFPEDQARESLKQIAKQLEAREQALRTADASETIANWLKPVLFEVLGAKPVSGVRIIGEEAVFEPTFVLPKSGASPREYHGDLRSKAGGNSLSCLIWTLPWRVSLDSVATDPAFSALPVTEVVHRALAASDVPWAIVTNGRQLRLLSRVTSHKPRCFLEGDLVALIDRRTDQQALRAFRFMLGLFSARCFTEIDQASQALLDRVAQGSDRHGKEIGDELKSNVFSALQELGEGFLAYMRANPQPTDEWRQRKRFNLSRENFLVSDDLLDDIYHESLSLMYRLLFLFYAESRELLPLDNDLYQTYSLESIRDDVHSTLDDPDKAKRFFARGNTDLWKRLTELFGFLDKGWGKVIPPYNGGLFDSESHQFLETFAVGDYYLARSIDLLSRTKPRAGQSRGEGRKKVTYRDLDVRHLGSIYEGILEYTAKIADQDFAILRQGSSPDDVEEYVPLADLNRQQNDQLAQWRAAIEENPDTPQLPRGCKITGLVGSGQYYLAFGGRDSKRKSSGSYYTPDYIVQYIVESALGPLVHGECRPGGETVPVELQGIEWKEQPRKASPLTPDEILQLRVLDPAMGSGHFLVAVTEYLARAYRHASLAAGSLPDEAKADEEFIRYKRIIAERCMYGVDANPMAVELAKLSMWLFTMDPGRPLSFLDHNLKCGNALIGATIDDLGSLAHFDANGRASVRHDPRQRNLFQEQFKTALPLMLRDIFEILQRETLSTADIQDKKTLDETVREIKKPFRNIGDVWTGTFFGGDAKDYLSLLTDLDLARERQTPAATDLRFFHWQLEFPQIWFDASGDSLPDPGFTAIVGNPPYDVLASKELARDVTDELNFFRSVPRFELAMRGKTNLYKLFAALSLMLLLNKRGTLGLIVPMALLGDDQALGIRSHLISSGLKALEVFPQKDDPRRRVFESAKLSTTIFIAAVNSGAADFTVRVHPGREIENESPTVRLARRDIEKIDPDNLAIPTCNPDDLELVKQVLSAPVVRLGHLAKSKQGEVNETTHREYLADAGDEPVLRGAAITLYCVREASQGEDRFLKRQAFMNAFESDSKARDIVRPRMGFQRSAPQNNFRRLIAASIPAGRACFDTVSYVTNSDTSLDLDFLVAYMNSEFADWYFRLFSSGSKVNEYQFNALPVPRSVPPCGLQWRDMVKQNEWGRLRTALRKVLNKPGEMPEDAIEAISECSRCIAKLEAARSLASRSDRSELGERSAVVQEVIDRALFWSFGFSDDQIEYIKARRGSML